MREFLRSRAAKVAVMTCVVSALMVCSAFAVEPEVPSIDTAAITTAFTSGFNSMVTNSINMISAMVPIALTLAGVVFLVGKAMKWFKTLTKG